MRARPLFYAAVGAAVLAVVLLAAAGAGTQAGAWTFRAGFTLLRWAVYVGVAGAVLSVIALAVVRPRGRNAALLAAAIVVGLGVAALPASWMRRARSVPPIHDITTDLADPPAFVAVLPLRADAPNSAAYGGDSVAAKQRSGYPDIVPLRLAEPPAAAFARAERAARAMGWAMVATDSASGRIEATASTRWFGFKDDVVVRVRPDGASASRIDVRSVSRVGGSDVGTNAARIRAYLARVAG